jgi:hypothetical protein
MGSHHVDVHSQFDLPRIPQELRVWHALRSLIRHARSVENHAVPIGSHWNGGRSLGDDGVATESPSGIGRVPVCGFAVVETLIPGDPSMTLGSPLVSPCSRGCNVPADRRQRMAEARDSPVSIPSGLI